MFGANVKMVFFDRKAVIDAVDAATRKVLSAFGGRVRKAARASIQERRGRSSPGLPPHSHMRATNLRLNRKRASQGRPKVKGWAGLKYILYAYDAAHHSVVIGPASNRVRSLTIPEILEEGNDPRGKVKARPFMGPTFRKEQASLPSLWAGSVK